MRWRPTGTEQLYGDEPRKPLVGRRADGSWIDRTGPVIAPGSEWVAGKLRELDGEEAMIAPVGPVFTVDLTDPASAFWAVGSLLYRYDTEGEVPPPTWRDTTPPGPVN